METAKNINQKKQKRKINDFILLFIGITVVIVGLIFLKMLMHKMSLM